jgi:hypothetical protein
MADDTDIGRTANLWALRYGDSAVARARRMVAQFQSVGDREGGDVWRRIALAIEALRAPPSDMLN